MEETAAIEEAVRSRLSVMRVLQDGKTGPIILAETLGFGKYYPRLEPHMISKTMLCGMLLVRSLRHAGTFVLNDRECDTLIGSHESYPSNIAHASELAAFPPDGFVYFSKPIPDPTKREPDFPIAALSWSVTAPEEALLDLHHLGEREDEFTLTLVPYAKTSVVGGVFAQTVPTPIYPVGYVVWAIGVDGGGKMFEDPQRNAMNRDERACYVKVLLAFLALLHSDVLTEEEPTERTKKDKERVKHARKKDPALNTKIKVVRYRKRTGSGNKLNKPSKSGRKVGVRYWRGAFWKWVWFPSLEDNRLRRIEPFATGPEDAPEVGYDRIFRPPLPAKPKPQKGH